MTALRKPTRHQQTHRPRSRVQILCASQKPLVDGFCPDCGRYLKRGNQDHTPLREGSLGWIERYGDGSTRIEAGEVAMPYCRACEQANVPAVHRTPLGHDCAGPTATQRR